MKNYFVILLILISSSSLFSQYNSPLSKTYIANIEKEMHFIGSNVHTSIKPFALSINDTIFHNSIPNFHTQKTFLHHILNDNLFFVQSDNYEFYVNPLLHLELGVDNEQRYVNSRGIQLKGRVGSKVRFSTSFYENQMNVSDYVYDFMLSNNRIVPGQGMAKLKNHSISDDLDFSFAEAYVNYDASRFFNIEFGHGKHFLGDGYRSLLLSDNSFNYPYFKITTNVWKFKYVNLFSSLQQLDFKINAVDISREKLNATHYLSANIGSRFTINLFESIILGEDSLGNLFDINYFNPIIFYRPVEYSISYSRLGNAIMGLGLKYKLSNLTHLYGQFVLDEFSLSEIRSNRGYWANKFGGQIGFKCFDFLGDENLSIQSELNTVRPFTYSHKHPVLNYSHYSQPLAHPFGASFIENITILSYRKESWGIDLKLIHAKRGGQILGDTTNYGNDIFISYEDSRNDFDNEIAQGNTNYLRFIDVRVSYLINPKTNLKLEVGLSDRLVEDLNSSSKNQYLFFSIKTDLRNIYYDF